MLSGFGDVRPGPGLCLDQTVRGLELPVTVDSVQAGTDTEPPPCGPAGKCTDGLPCVLHKGDDVVPIEAQLLCRNA